jgi:Amt family ammonium transporter
MEILERWAWRLTWLLPVWGAVTIPATLTQQPDADTDFAAYADYVTTSRFLVGHLVGSIGGTVLGILGIVGLAVILARTRVARAALAAATVAIVGCGLLLPVFGVAAFAQPAIGNAAHAGLAGAQQIDSDVYGLLTIAVGVFAAFAFTVGLAWLGIAVARSGRFPRWSGWLLIAAGFFIGLGGFLVGLLQPIGGLCLLAGGLGIAWLGSRAGQRSHPEPFQPARSE